MFSLTLCAFALNNSILAFSSKEKSLMLDTSAGDGYSWVFCKLLICSNTKRCDSYDVPCKRLLVVERTVRTPSAPDFLTVLPPPAHLHVACPALLLVLWVFLEILDSARFPAGNQTVSSPLKARFSACLLAVSQIFTKMARDKRAFFRTRRPFQTYRQRRAEST